MRDSRKLSTETICLEERRQLALVGLDGGSLEVWDGGDGVASVLHGLVPFGGG